MTPKTNTIHPTDTLKMLRETLCVAQTAIPLTDPRHTEHVLRIQRLIDDIDRERPVGPDGKHGDRHTNTCGCDEAPTGRSGAPRDIAHPAGGAL